jgi:hypothetical protein
MSDAKAFWADMPPIHAEHEVDAEWRPIGEYDKAARPLVLLRGSGQMVLGEWGVSYDPLADEEGRVEAWRSQEDSTLESPLWFEPEQFAILEETDRQHFVER